MKSIRAYEIWVFGNHYFEDTQIGVLRRVLEEVIDRNEDVLQKLQFHKGIRRQFVSPTREKLRVKRDRPDLLQDHSVRLSNGWWLYTNMAGSDVLLLLSLACSIAGWKFGEDIKINAKQWPGESGGGSPIDLL